MTQKNMLAEVLQSILEGVKALSLVGMARCTALLYLSWLVRGGLGLAMLTAVNAVYIGYCYRCWEQAFIQRHRRGSTVCPSSTLLPPEAKYSVRGEARRLSEEGELLIPSNELDVFVHSAETESVKVDTDSSAVSDPDSKPGEKKLPFRALRQRSHGNSFLAYGRKLKRTVPNRLDMDHIKVSFKDYLWAMYFIGPNAVVLWLFGIPKLLVRRWLCRRGWATPLAHDPAQVVANLLLDSVGEVTNFVGEKNADEEGPQIGLFLWPELPMLARDGTFMLSKRPFSVEVCLDSRKMLRAMLGSRVLSARDALVLIWFDTIGASHVKLHSLANWSVNNESQRGSDLWRDSVATVMYNHFGYTGFPRLCKLFHACGAASTPFAGIQQCFEQGVHQGVSNHRHIGELMRYSRSVSFVTKLRNHFLNIFNENKTLFPGSDGEALFVGTVLHSLDHQLCEWNVKDPLWISSDSEDFSTMAELGQIVRVGFVQDLPLLNFNRKLSQSSNPFWSSVYEHAFRLDSQYANAIDTCIIR